MFILATEVQQNIEQNVEELDKKVSRFSTVIDDGINKAIDFGFDLFLAIVIFIIGRIVLSLVRKLFKKIMNRSNIDEGVVKFLDSMIKVFGYIVIIITICGQIGIQTTSFTIRKFNTFVINRLQCCINNVNLCNITLNTFCNNIVT